MPTLGNTFYFTKSTSDLILSMRLLSTKLAHYRQSSPLCVYSCLKMTDQQVDKSKTIGLDISNPTSE